MSIGKKKGRPPGAATIERSRIEAMLKDPPPSILMTAEERADFDASRISAEAARAQLLKEYKYGATTPDAHAYEMASLGDESLHGYEDQILQRDKVYRNNAQRYRRFGAETAKSQALSRAGKVCENFKSLLSRVEPLGNISISQASELMRRLWYVQRNTGDPPSERTLRSWIRQASPFPEHRLGKASSGDKSPP